MKQYISRTVIFDDSIRLVISKPVTSKEAAKYPELEILNSDASMMKLMDQLGRQGGGEIKVNLKNNAGGYVDVELKKIGEG